VTRPDISVIVPVHDAMPYLITCLSSVLEQSLERERLELVAVDNGSTDESGALLDLLAASWSGMRVIHQEDSGGPSRPRNRGLDVASGRYVYFLDADDYLGAEALERMLTLAEENGSDLVACRRKHVGNKLHVLGAPKARHSGIDTSAAAPWLNDSPISGDLAVYLTVGSDCKHLFRRERIEQLGLRFAEGVHFGEDLMFSVGYLEGAKISVEKDYCCYYERLRDDGGNLTTLLVGTEMHLDAMERGWRLRETYEPEWRRALFARDIALDLARLIFGDHFAGQEAPARRRLVERARALLAKRLPARMAARLPALERLKVELISRGMEPELCELARAMAAGEQGKDVIAGGRVYGGYPRFSGPAAAIPDDYYDVTAELAVCHHLAGLSVEGSRLRLTGHAYIEHVDSAATTTTMILRQRGGKQECRVPVPPVPVAGLAEECGRARYDHELAGFDVELDLASVAPGPLPTGQWGIFLALTAQGVSKEAPLGGDRAASASVPVPAQPDPPFSVSFTKHGALIVQVPGDQPGPADQPGPGGEPRAEIGANAEAALPEVFASPAEFTVTDVSGMPWHIA